jgi:hypothetical protein
MKTKIEKTLAAIVGKSLWTCRRAADMATFQFGERTKTQDYYGRPAEVGEYALHVQCAWRIARGDQILVGSRDLYYPAEYDNNEPLPSNFNWDRDPNRRDRLLQKLFEDGARGFAVQSFDVGAGGAFRIILNDGMSLELFPDDSLCSEHWRLFAPTKDEPHSVMTGSNADAEGPSVTDLTKK